MDKKEDFGLECMDMYGMEIQWPWGAKHRTKFHIQKHISEDTFEETVRKKTVRKKIAFQKLNEAKNTKISQEKLFCFEGG